MSKLPPPTDEVARLVAIVGPEAALELIEQRGGTRLFVSSTDVGLGGLKAIMGLEGAAKLVEACGREYFKVPVAREWRVLVYRSRGLSYAEIARKVGCSENTVWRILNAHAMTGCQLDMFERR
ncbi:helix-turn-helix domain-containing protein [Azorhizobium doebereinerae]|uniref:helix-turn-helix domain-containing protein n=1 Tax=Azorhizobium doebereinerae TaxID=281091 RepID=UPI00048EAB26|nr:helix-turn-helix domain-containing protein [Azorhizobium doebereinerae]